MKSLGGKKKLTKMEREKELSALLDVQAETEIPSQWGLDLTALCGKCSEKVKKAYVRSVLRFYTNT